VVAAFGIGLMVQAGIFTHTKSGITVLGRQGAKMPELISVRVFAQYLLADRGINAVWSDRVLLTIGAAVFVLAILAALFHRADRKHQRLATGFLAVSVASFVVPVWGRGTDLVALTAADRHLSFFHSSSTAYVAADRFSVVPVMMLASAVAVLVAGASKCGSRIRTQSMALVFAAHIALVTILGFPVTNARSSFPSWSATVASDYKRECGGAPSAKLVSLTPGAIGLLGRSGFAVTIACRDLAP
jgi:hypothetical protein